MKNTFKKAMACAIAFSVLHVTVFGTQWYDAAVTYSQENGIVSEDFDTEGLLTRGEMAEMLANVIDTELYYTDVPFEDLTEDDSVTDAVMTLYSAGIYSGVETDGSLLARMGDAIKREEAAAFIVRTYGFEGSESELTFDDADEISDYAVEDISILVSQGIMSGYEDNTVRPKNNVSKVEFLTMLYKADEAANGETLVISAVSLIDEADLSSDITITVLNEGSIAVDDAIILSFDRADGGATAIYAYNPQEFQLEKLVDGEWIVMSRKTSEITEIDYQLKAETASERKITLSDFYDNLEDGEYRLVYSFAVNGVGIEKGTQYAAVNITITSAAE